MNPSKIIRYKAESKHPCESAYHMYENGAAMLWHEYDSSETKNWELEIDGHIVTLSLFYNNIMDGEFYEATIQNALEEYWTLHRVKYSLIQ